MGSIRDFFAAVGFCESTQDLARRPGLIDCIIDRSQPYAALPGIKDRTYEARLRATLSQASTYALDRLLEENIMVGLDRRLAGLESGFWDSTVYSVYYDQGHKKLLCLYDNGKMPDENGLFDIGITDWSGRAIDGLIEKVMDRNANHDLLLGTTHARYSNATKTSLKYFAWHNSYDFASELEKNPELLTSPLVSAARRAGPPQPVAAGAPAP